MKTSTKFLIDRTMARGLAWSANVGARAIAPIARRDHIVDPNEVRTVVVAKLLGMGSIIQATPLLHDLRRTFPRARLVFVTTRTNRGLIERLGVIDEAVYIDDASSASLATSTAAAIVKLLKKKIDLYFDLEVYSAGASVLSIASGARNRVGFYRNSARFKKGIFTHLAVFNPRAPISAIYRQLHLCVGGQSSGDEPRFGPIHVTRRDKDELAATLQRNSIALESRFVVVNPNASDLLLERRWPTSKFIELVTELTRRGTQVVFIGAKSEVDYVRTIVANLPASSPRVVDTSGKLSLGELFALLETAACVVTNDTGPMHFSIALDRPTVCLFGPVTPEHYGVRKANVETIYHPVYCSPCAHELEEPPCAGNNVCMQRLDVDEVLAAVERQLAGKSAPVRLPLTGVTYAAPDGSALGVIVRATVETRPLDTGSSAEKESDQPRADETQNAAQN